MGTSDPIPGRSAGAASRWVADAIGVIRGERDADVPCDGCTACCRASRFVHIRPDETETLARIPTALRFPAPGLPAGHVVLGYRADGSCPMLLDGRCSIYDHRPRTCRAYDCRVLAAAGLRSGSPGIDERVAEWIFEAVEDPDVEALSAVRASALALVDHETDHAGPDGTELAVAAVVLHDMFLGGGNPDREAVVEALSRRRSGPAG